MDGKAGTEPTPKHHLDRSVKLKLTRKGSQIAQLRLNNLGSGDYEIAWLEVVPEYRGQRLASKLLLNAIAIAKERDWTLVAFVDPRNGGLSADGIKAMLRRKGFKHCWYDFGDRPNQTNHKRAMFL